jgi:Toprim domain-containing protein
VPDGTSRYHHPQNDLAGEIAQALGGAKKAGAGWLARCPGHLDRTPSLSLRVSDDGRLLLHCFNNCDPLVVFAELRARGLLPSISRDAEYRPRPPSKPLNDDPGRLALARWLWRKKLPLNNTLAERYLRETRGCRGPFPCTLGFLPANKDKGYPPALIAAYGMPIEIEPGELALPIEAVRGVQLIKLTPDARKLEKPITIGRCLGTPIVITPMNDNLGLAIAEGVEDAISIAEATGLGAWAAGGASRLKALAAAVPTYTDCITILQDDDPAGRQGADELVAELLKRGRSWRERIERVQL